MYPAGVEAGACGMGVPVDRVRSVARFHAASGCFTAAGALILFLVLRMQRAEHFIQCRCACGVLTAPEAAALLALPVEVLLSSVVQVLAALLAQVATGRRRVRRVVTFLALVASAITAWLSGRLLCLLFNAVFGSFWCFGAVAQVAIAIGGGIVIGVVSEHILHDLLDLFYGDE